MTNKDIILKSIRYIEANLKENVCVLDMANAVHYSLYHFIRLFQNVTGYSPKSYQQQRRLSEALKTLKTADKKIIDIAFDFQFNSHEAFSRAFKKQFEMTPRQVREGGSHAGYPVVNPIDEDFLNRSDQVTYEPPQLVGLSSLVLSGISFFNRDNVGIDSLSKEWGQLMREVPTILNRRLPERFYQIQYWSETQELGGFYFFLGVEVDGIDAIQPQLVVKCLPRSRYLKFIHKGLSKNVGHTYRYIYNQFLPETDYRLTKPYNFEFYGEKFLGPENTQSTSEIYIPVE